VSQPRLRGIGSHHSALPQTEEWLTPPHVLGALGPFDLDPCSPPVRPWPTASRHLTAEDDGLSHPWEGRVWLNPPYGKEVEQWLARLADHGDGVALVFARTETRWFFDQVWRRASALLFLEGRLTFHRPDGSPAKAGHNSGGPSVLIAYGEPNGFALASCGLAGSLVHGWTT
jgi:hypothetical protein